MLDHLPIQRFRWVSDRYWGLFRISVNAYFVDGLLLDTGPPRLSQQVFSDVEGLPVQQLVLTHHHEDHSGNVAMLQKHWDCPVYAHPRCTQILAAPPAISFPEHLIWGQHRAVQGIQPIGERLSTEQYQFEIYHTPGHAADHICLYERDQGWLFSGDLYVHHRIRYFVANEDMAAQMASLRAMLALDFEYFFCGHNIEYTNGKALFQRKLDFFETFVQQVQYWHQKGYPPSQILKQLNHSERWFMRITSRGWLSALNMVHAALRVKD